MQSITKVFSDIVKPYIDTVKQALTDQVNNDGCKNHLGMSLSNVVNNGITYQNDGNNIITANGTVTQSPSAAGGTSTYITGLVVGETYVLSGLPESTALSGGEAFMKLYKNDSSYSEIKTSSGSKTLTFTYDGTNARAIDIGVRTVGAVVTNAVFKPMICLKSLYDADPTFAPYAKSNKELTEAVTNQLGDATLAGTYLSDCNNVASSGTLNIYGASSSTANSPYTTGVETSANSFVILSRVDTNTNWGMQLAFPMTSVKGIYMRFKASGTWGAWSKITP